MCFAAVGRQCGNPSLSCWRKCHLVLSALYAMNIAFCFCYVVNEAAKDGIVA